MCDRGIHIVRIDPHACRPEIVFGVEHDTGSYFLVFALILEIPDHTCYDATEFAKENTLTDGLMRILEMQTLGHRFIDDYIRRGIAPLYIGPDDGIAGKQGYPEHPHKMFVDEFYFRDILAVNAELRRVIAARATHIPGRSRRKADRGYCRHSGKLLPQYLSVCRVGYRERDDEILVETQIAVLKKIHLAGHDDRADDHQLRNS